MKPFNKVVWGVIGVGDVCEKKSAPAMQKIPHSEIKIVMRRDGDKAQDYAQRHDIPRWTDDAEGVLADPDVNAIYIATPPNVHADLALRAAAAGKPVYVEKPMARTYNECRRMVDTFQQANLPLWVAYYRRALPNVLRVKELLDEEAIGAVRLVTIQLRQPLRPALVADSETEWRVDPAVSGGGYFHDLASHQFDLLDFLLGPIEQATGFAANQAGVYPADDIVTASFVFANGVMGSGHWCFTTDPVSKEDQITIIGEKGHIHFDAFTDLTVAVDASGFGQQEYTFTMPEHIQQPLIQQVVDELQSVGQCVSSGVSAARTNWVMDEIVEAR